MVEQEQWNADHVAKKTVLVVEDEVFIRLYLQEIRVAGFIAIEASSGDEAFAVLEQPERHRSRHN